VDESDRLVELIRTDGEPRLDASVELTGGELSAPWKWSPGWRITVQEGITAMLEWIEQRGERTPGATILAEAMVKATRDPEFRRWTKRASRRFRAIILERLQTARVNHEIAPALDTEATAVLLAAALDGLLFHHLVDPRLDVRQTAEPIAQMLGAPALSSPKKAL
jgi:hypothetical protein